MTTKKLLTLCSFALLTLVFFSCKKEDVAANVAEIETTFELSGNQAVADNLTQDAVDVVEEAAGRNNLLGQTPPGVVTTNNWLPPCAVITITGNFPAKNIKIDFGTGCLSPNGVFRKGIINIVLTDSVRNTGSTATITFDNYYVNGYKKEGTITWTNITQSGSNRKWTRNVANGKITAPNGNYWLHTANLTFEQTIGGNTPLNITDDVYEITGTRTVTNSAGRTRTSTTQTALQKKTACANIDKGILSVQGPNHTAVIDFGDGTCDNLATISIDGRPARTILLR
ncbi:MAG: hypothetical protein KA319_04660 [Ferruginibacter sp.]|nr:hypothetical protein [Ferruginibacter sp.]